MTDLIILFPILALASLALALDIMHSATVRRFTALRRNCFVTNEKGHRVRYVDASAAMQARAEK